MKAFRTTAAAGSLMFIPAGFAYVDRGLGTDSVQGWRLHIIEGSSVLQSVSTLEEKFLTYSSVENNLVLKMFQSLREGLEKDGEAPEGSKDE